MLVHERPVNSDTRAVVSPHSDSALSPEVYRQVYVSLDLPPDNHSVIGVTSAIAGEGRTTLALGLARTLAADSNVRVMLVEVDLERPSLAAYFGISPFPGLCDVLRGENRLEDVVRRSLGRPAMPENLSVVTAGASGTDAARLLRRLPINDPFHDPQDPTGIIILDLPPIMNHSYSPLAASVADAVVLVVRAGVTPIDVVREAIVRLEDRPPRGVILNGARSSLPSWWPERGA